MLCEKCGQREANIHYTEVINGVRTDHNICSHCAKELELGGPYAALFEGDSPIGKLLSSLFGMELAGGETSEEEKMQEITCPLCHTSYREFVEKSRFGCPDCYNMFDLLMGERIKALQGSSSHTGKQPKFFREEAAAPVDKEAAQAEELAVLHSRLQEALQEEEYELAAQYRDQIRALKKQREGMEQDA